MHIINLFLNHKSKMILYSATALSFLLIPDLVQAQCESETVPPTNEAAEFNNEEIEVVDGIISEKASETIENAYNTNKVFNGEFDSVSQPENEVWTGSEPNGWHIWNPIEADTYKAEVNEEGHLILESNKDPFRAAVIQDVKNIDDTKIYELSYDIKTENMTNIARVRIQSLDENNKYTNQEYASGTSYGTKDWETYHYEYRPPKNTKTAKLELFFEPGTGTTYFDNIKLVEIVSDDDQNENILDSNVTLSKGKFYIPNIGSLKYIPEDENIIKHENGLLKAHNIGKSKVNIIKNDIPIHQFEVKVTEETISERKTKNLLKQWNEITTGNEFYDPQNEKMYKIHTVSEDTTTKNIDLYNWDINKTFLWDDLSDFSKSSTLTSNYRRLESIAKQVTNPHSQIYMDTQALMLLNDGLLWMYHNHYNEKTSINGNWWDYEIGVPRAINNTLSLLYDYFSFEEINKYIDPIYKFVPESNKFRVTTGNPFEPVGGNLVDMGRVKIIAGILKQDNETILETNNFVLEGIKYVDQGEGFYKDGSYIDHTNVALNGAYGSVFIDALSQLLPVIDGFNPIPKDKLEILYEWIEKSFLPLLNKGETMDFVRGRSISRPKLQSHESGSEILRGVARVALMSNENVKKDLLSKVKYHISSNKNFFDIYETLKSYRDIALFEKVENDPSLLIHSKEQNLYPFNNMDKLSYHHPKSNFAFGLSMHSSATQNYETMNGENLRGWHTGDGMAYLYNGDNDHYNEGYWATINPYLLPGTTILNKKRIDGPGDPKEPNQTVMHSSFVGSNKLNERFGTSAMDFYNFNRSLKAKKFWHINNDQIIFMGSGIKALNNEDFITVLSNRKAPKNSSYQIKINGEDVSNGIYKNVNSIFLESDFPNTNIGYVMLKPATVKVNKNIRTGDWQDINSMQDSKTETNEFVEITLIDQADKYAYVVVPNISQTDFNVLLKDHQIEILENNDAVQSVFDAKNNVWSVVKYDDQKYDVHSDLTLTKAGIYTIQKLDNTLIVSYLNPVNYSDNKLVFDDLTSRIIKESSDEDQSIIYELILEKNINMSSLNDNDIQINKKYNKLVIEDERSIDQNHIKNEVEKINNKTELFLDQSEYKLHSEKETLPKAGSANYSIILPIISVMSGVAIKLRKFKD